MGHLVITTPLMFLYYCPNIDLKKQIGVTRTHEHPKKKLKHNYYFQNILL